MHFSSLMTSPGESLPLNIGLRVSGVSFGFSGSPCFPEGMGLVASRRETILMNESIEICLKLNPCGSSLCSLFERGSYLRPQTAIYILF